MYGYSSSIDWDQFTEAERAVIEALPHGSGIDYNWHCEKNTAGKIVAHNAYHGMDDNGFYCFVADFSVRWTPGQERDFRLMFHGTNARYWIERQALRDYLEDLFYYCLTEASKEN
jgi:hypothetical protein